MSESEGGASVSEASLGAGRLARAGQWAVGLAQDEPFAVSRRCRHQLADLSEGRVDADGCLVCPWHGARYEVRSGRMVGGPRGFLWYHGPTPVYTGLVHILGRVLPLRVGTAIRRAGRIIVGD